MSELVWERTRAFERAWIVGWWAASRAVVLAAAAVTGAVGPRGYTRSFVLAHPLGLLASWDGRWYRTVAENGYLLEPGRQSDPAFFPLFPLLLRAGHALGVSYSVAGVVIANIAFLAAMLVFEALTRELLGADVARRATILLAVCPLSFVFSMAYPESVVLALATGAGLAAYRGRWGVATVLLGLGTLARPETAFVALALFPVAWRERSGRALAAVAAPAAALGSFALYLQRTIGDPLGWTSAERAWGRHFSTLGLVRALRNVPQQFAGNQGIARDVACFLLYLALLAIAYRRGVPRSWVLSGALVVVLPTFSGSFHSIGRFGLLAPAIFWGAAQVVRSRWVFAISGIFLIAGVATLPLLFP
jgi:hypothetical protein